jgi:hypothetical protein
MRRNKAYRPRPVRAGAALALIARHNDLQMEVELDADQLTDLGLAYRLALDAMCNGGASEENWETVACSLNIGLVLTERGFGKEHEPLFVTALAGAFRSKLRADSGKGWAFDGPALTAIKSAFEVHDQQIEMATVLEMRDAVTEVRRRSRLGNVYREGT